MLKIRKILFSLLVFIALLMFAPCSILAEVPPKMTYQGILVDKDGFLVPNGFYGITFSIYDGPVGGSPLWTEEQDVNVSDGLYNITLGAVNPIELPFDKAYYLGVTVETDSEMAPRQPLTSVGYAFRAKTADTLPIGAVIDWWRPDTSWPVPDGYKVCDGTAVTDQDSPLYNKILPDLTGKFILGVSRVDDIGKSGGNDNHDHEVDIDHDHTSMSTTSAGSHQHSSNPPLVITGSAGSHSHSVDVPDYTGTLSSQYAGSHNHKWAEFWRNPNDGKEQWITYSSTGQSRLTTLWDNGIGNEGSGHYPLSEYYNNSFYTLSGGNHRHEFGLNHNHPAVNSGISGTHSHSLDIPSVLSSSSGTHNHSVDLSPLGTQIRTTENQTHLPPYIGLLKIMRIK